MMAIWGDTLVLFAAALFAVYSVFLKLRIKDQSQIDMQLFIGFVGLWSLVLYWFIGLLLHLTGIEPFQLPSGRAASATIINVGAR